MPLFPSTAFFVHVIPTEKKKIKLEIYSDYLIDRRRHGKPLDCGCNTLCAIKKAAPLKLKFFLHFNESARVDRL